MQPLAKLLPPLALVGALAMVPIATTAMAAAESDTQKELETFFSVFERVRANYVDKVDDHTLIKGAIDGMLSALDPHSSYVEASDFNQLRTTTEGNYGGLGLTVSTEDGAVKVIAPTEDTPADRAGIKAGDYITHIDGEFLYGFTLDEAVEKMRGKPGTSTKLTIVRPGRDKPFDVSITRERIELIVLDALLLDLGEGHGEARIGRAVVLRKGPSGQKCGTHRLEVAGQNDLKIGSLELAGVRLRFGSAPTHWTKATGERQWR